MRTFHFDKEKYGFKLLMDLHTFEDNPNAFFEQKIHTTDFFEIFIFERAAGNIELNGHLLDVGKNSFFFISPFQKKSCHIDISKVRGFHLVFQNEFLSDFFEDKLFAYRMQYFYNAQHPQYLKLDGKDYELIKIILNEIIAEINQFQNDSPHIIRSILYFLLSKLNRLYAMNYNLSSKTESHSEAYHFKEVLEQHIRKFHKVNDYCELINVQRNKLNKIIKQHYNITVKKAIHLRLLQEIKIELCYTNKTISEIAFDLNFSEPNNLTRFFKRMEGISPLSYKLNYQSDRNLV